MNCSNSKYLRESTGISNPEFLCFFVSKMRHFLSARKILTYFYKTNAAYSAVVAATKEEKMAADKYNFELTTLVFIQKSYQFLLAWLRYQSEMSSRKQEYAFYQKVYGDAMKNPESVRLGYVSGALDREMLSQIAEENDIHIGLSPDGDNYVVYDAKDEEKLLKIIETLNTKEAIRYESNTFHEVKYGFRCRTTGEFIPFMDKDGNYLDSDGNLHTVKDLSDDEKEKCLTALQERKPKGILWHRGGDGLLVNEYGRVCLESSNNRYILDENGNLKSLSDGSVEICYNEYGDYVDNHGNIVINEGIGQDQDFRFAQMAGRLDKQDGQLYGKTEHGNFLSQDGRVLTAYGKDGSYVREADGRRVFPDIGNKEVLYERCPGGFASRDEFVPNYNEYGDYYKDGHVFLNDDVELDVEDREQALIQAEKRPEDLGMKYRRTPAGNMQEVVTGKVSVLYREDGTRIPESGEMADELDEEPERDSDEQILENNAEEEPAEDALEEMQEDQQADEGQEEQEEQEEKQEKRKQEARNEIDDIWEEAARSGEPSDDTIESTPDDPGIQEEAASYGADTPVYEENIPADEDISPVGQEEYSATDESYSTAQDNTAQVTTGNGAYAESHPEAGGYEEKRPPEGTGWQESYDYGNGSDDYDLWAELEKEAQEAESLPTSGSETGPETEESRPDHIKEVVSPTAPSGPQTAHDSYLNVTYNGGDNYRPKSSRRTYAQEAEAGSGAVAGNSAGFGAESGDARGTFVDPLSQSPRTTYKDPKKADMRQDVVGRTNYREQGSQNSHGQESGTPSSSGERDDAYFNRLARSRDYEKKRMEGITGLKMPDSMLAQTPEMNTARTRNHRESMRASVSGIQSGIQSGVPGERKVKFSNRVDNRGVVENITARKKYGFQSMAPFTDVVKPSASGVFGAAAQGYQGIVRGGAKDANARAFMSFRSANAAFGVAAGSALYRGALKSSSDYFQKMQANGRLAGINKALAGHGMRSVDIYSANGIKAANADLLRFGEKAGVLERSGGRFLLRKMTDSEYRMMFGKAGINDPVVANDIIAGIKKAADMGNAQRMLQGSRRMASNAIRMRLAQSDESLSYAYQGADTMRVTANFVSSVRRADQSRMLRNHARFQKNKETLEKTADAFGNMTASQFRKEKLPNARERLRKDWRFRSDYTESLQQYRQLQEAEKARSWNKRHNYNEKRLERFEKRRAKKAERLQQRRQYWSRVGDTAKKPLRAAGHYMAGTRPGRKYMYVYKKVTTNPRFKVVKEAAKKINQKAKDALQFFSRVWNDMKAALLKILGAYILMGVGIIAISVFILIPIMGVMSMETNDSELDGGPAMEDVYDKSSTMTGIIYNELRFMEVQWASETRSYGTSVSPLTLNALKFTEYNVTAKQYALSQTGVDDILSNWAYDSTKTTTGVDADGNEVTLMYEGILGPEPFEGAAPEDYKLLQDIDGGNALEIRGKPQEGYTSNAKQIASMGAVFYQQAVDTLRESANASKGIQGFTARVKAWWKSAWTYFEIKNTPILGWIAKNTGWSWSSVYRNYAYPLMQASHQENFYLSEYLYPTKFTSIESVDAEGNLVYSAKKNSARWDGAKGGDPTENGDQSVKVDQVTGQKAKNGQIGATTEGGSGKVTATFLSSVDAYGEYGDDGYQAIELCPSNVYNGYGCLQRENFYYKYNGHFASDAELNVTHADELASLYYGGNPDTYADPDNVSDVSGSVSPWDNDSDNEKGYNRDSCILHILQVTDKASECWVLESQEELTGYDFEANTDLLDTTFYSDEMNREYLNREGSGDDELTIQKVVETAEGCDVYASLPFGEGPAYDSSGNALLDENGDPLMETDYNNGNGVILHFKHECAGNHRGTYCGGHLQLKTRGVVYGFSEEQEEEGTFSPAGTISAYAPKYLDPIYYKDPNFYADAEDRYPNDSDVDEKERNAYPDLHVWNVDDHTLSSGETPLIEKDDMLNFYKAEDLFDVDDLIKRAKETYPGYGSTGEAVTWDGSSTTAMEKWTGWTITNMGLAVTLAATDWYQNYGVPDTQVSVGGVYNNADPQVVNALSENVKNRVLMDLSEGLNMAADILDPTAKNNDGTILTDEQREEIDRIRHLNYAFDTVGKVSYSQEAHANLYGNLCGKATDCSGYVSNIWRDRFDVSQTTASLYKLASNAGVLHEYHGIGTSGIKTGDIILKDPEDTGQAAHALLYVGVFSESDIYGGGSSEERVYTIDCSSMVLTSAYLPSGDTPVKSWFSTNDDGSELSLKDNYHNYENNGKDPMVRGGNVRFCDREYVNEDTPNMYYISMADLPRIANRQLRGDYSDLGDATISFWESEKGISDITQVREAVNIQFPEVGALMASPDDVTIPEDDRLEPDHDESYVPDGEGKVLDMYQYINQGTGDWKDLKRGGIASNSTIKQSGCIDCCYLMAASYYNQRGYDVARVLSNSKYYSGNAFNSNAFVGDFGISQTKHSGYSVSAIRNAIDAGHPAILEINGVFSFHNRNSSHFMVIMGYNDNGFMVYDPGSYGNTYCNTGRVIPYTAFSNGPGTVVGFREITAG